MAAGEQLWKNSLSDLMQSIRISSWMDSVLAAEAMKTGLARWHIRLTPRLPSLTGRLA